MIKALFYFKAITCIKLLLENYDIYKRLIVILTRKTFKTTIYIIKIFDFLFNIILIKFFLLINSACLVANSALVA